MRISDWSSDVCSSDLIADKDEWLAGLRLEGPVAGFTVRANLSTLRFADQTSRTSNGWRAGVAGGAGQRTDQGPTGWYTGDLTATRSLGAHDLAFGLNTNLYETDQRVVDTVDWRATAGGTLRTRTFGRPRTIGAFVEIGRAHV